MSRIFLTGATGFIGRALVNELVSRKMGVVCLIRKKEQEKTFKKSKYLDFILGELPEIRPIERLFKSSDVVVHLANISDGKNYEEFYKINVEGTRNLVSACEKANISKFIFASSTVVFSEFKSPYIETKRLAEEIVKNSKLNYIILRPDMVYGKDSKRHIIDLIEEIRNKKLKLIVYGDIKIRPVYVKDIINSIVKSIEEKKLRNRIYNLGSEVPVSYKTLFKIIKKETRSKCFLVSIPFFITFILARLYNLINKKSTLYDWIKGNVKTNYSILDSKKELSFSPTPIGKGIKILLGN